MITIIKRVISISGKYKKKLIFSFVMGFLETSIPALWFFFVYLSFSWCLSGNVTNSKIVFMAVTLSVSILVRYIFKLLEYIFQSGVGYEVICEQRLELGQKLISLPMGFYDTRDAGELSSVLTNDMVFIEGIAMSYTSKVLGAIVSSALVILALFIMDWRIASIVVTAYPIALFINKLIAKIFTDHSVKRQQSHAETSSIMIEYLKGIYVIKAFRFAGNQKKRLESVLKNLEVVSYDFEMKAMPCVALYFTLFNLFITLTLLAISWFVLAGTISVSISLVLVTMVFLFYAPMELIGLISGILRLMNECLNRIDGILSSPIMDSDSKEVELEAYDVKFNKVNFSYGYKPILKDINFSVNEKSLTAIVGPSGSGKSTMLNLIARFWDVDSGNIYIGGVDLRTIKCDRILEHISIVFQNAYLFHDTIKANIKFGNHYATDAQIEDAAKKACCHEFITSMDKGYDTVVGEGGSTLSGGERQRITIARALLKDAPIVLLDEVTANIDPKNEKLIQKAINVLIKEKTVFVVAHKLSTIKNADQIIVLSENGTIEEQGKHDDLIEVEGLYKRLWLKSQKAGNWIIK